jgi:hypothetical protein
VDSPAISTTVYDADFICKSIGVKLKSACNVLR